METRSQISVPTAQGRWVYVTDVPEEVRTLLGATSGCEHGCGWVHTTDDEASTRLWVLRGLPCPHQPTWDEVVSVGGVIYAPRSHTNTKRWGWGAQQHPDGTLGHVQTIHIPYELLAETGRAVGAPDAGAVVATNPEGSVADVCALIAEWYTNRHTMRTRENLATRGGHRYGGTPPRDWQQPKRP